MKNFTTIRKSLEGRLHLKSRNQRSPPTQQGTTEGNRLQTAALYKQSGVPWGWALGMPARLAQMEERRSAEREVVSSNPGRTINQGL